MHVTLLVPFARVEPEAVRELRALLARFRSFPFTLPGVCEFPDGTVYLAPLPADPFVELVRAIWESWPEYPPYDGIHATIVPHLSIPDPVLERLLEAVPIEARAEEVWWMEEGAERWSLSARFPLEA